MRIFDRIDRDAIGELLKRDEYFWLDLTDPGEKEVADLKDIFGFHPLALEDTVKRGQRPKLDDFGEYMFLVYYGAEESERGDVELVEVHAFLSGGYIVTTHRRRCAALEEVRERLTAQPPRSEQFVVYRVLDGLTDTFFPVLERLDDRIERLDAAIFDRATPRQLEEITVLRRELVELRRIVTPQRDLLARGIDDILEIPGLEVDSRNYFRDVYDHSIRISDQIDSYRDLLSGSRDAYLSVVSNRLNQITKQLTVMATIFLPLSFVVGFFGQNFKWLVVNIQSTGAFFALGIGSVVVSVIALLFWFRRSDYI
ncbi:MAG TPA: magnesium/cobalt transporter CorA [Solirubrobacterales bacterium]|nr:magnesium/cobalt transporter CorA [Solirubrobacterales bacterium]